MGVRQGPHRPAQRAQPATPVDVREVLVDGGAQLQVEQVDQPVEQGVLAPHVRVEGHRREPDPLRDGAHRHRRQPALVDQGQCLVEDQPSLVVHRVKECTPQAVAGGTRRARATGSPDRVSSPGVR